jgi:phosphate/sulfate permease
METRNSSQVANWLRHVHRLAEEIGPRGSTTEEERRAAEYCADVFSSLGLMPTLETFYSAISIYHPHLYAALLMILSFVLYPLGGRFSAGFAAFLALFALASDLLELSFRDNPFRWIAPKAMSQNAVAILEPREDHHRDVILIGHLDSHRTPIIFSSARWVFIYQTFTTIAFLLFLAQMLLYALGTVTQWSWIWPGSVPSLLAAILLLAMCIQADRTPFSHGANDNATGAGMILTLAQSLKEEPLQKTRVWLVCTGCEEVQHYGAIDFFRRHGDEFKEPTTVVFEMLGCAGPAWLVKEGIIIPFRAHPDLVALSARLSSENPGWGAFPAQIRGGNTEMADALRAGIPAITLIGRTAEGEMPYWHQVEDTVDKLDLAVMERAYAMTWAFVRTLDEEDIRSV